MPSFFLTHVSELQCVHSWKRYYCLKYTHTSAASYFITVCLVVTYKHKCKFILAILMLKDQIDLFMGRKFCSVGLFPQPWSIHKVLKPRQSLIFEHSSRCHHIWLFITISLSMSNFISVTWWNVTGKTLLSLLYLMQAQTEVQTKTWNAVSMQVPKRFTQLH